MKPSIVVFSSSESYTIAEGISYHLEKLFTAKPWKVFFGENKTTPLWTFFKKLFYYDYAIVILSNDNIILDKNSGVQQGVPKDNVLFELGATMARLGPQKTIILVPDEPKINLPGYFKDIKPHIFTYQNKDSYTGDQNKEATADAALQIKEMLDQVTGRNFHSELPAQGLAHGYLYNFILPVMSVNAAKTITIVIPNQIMRRDDAKAFFEAQHNCSNTTLRVVDGRDLSVYVLKEKVENATLHIFDIPTTLFTAGDIVGKIEEFWREKDSAKVLEVDNEFLDELKHREIINFRRTLESMDVLKDKVQIISIDELPAHIAQLSQ